MTSRTITRCSCDVGCPCCGRCVETPSLSSSSWTPLPASSVAALRDIDSFIATYQVSPPPPLIYSPPALSSDSTTRTLTTQVESSASAVNCRTTLLEDSEELKPHGWDTAARLSDYLSNVESCNALQLQSDESMSKTHYGGLNGTEPALDSNAHNVISSSDKPDAQRRSDVIPPAAAAAIYRDTSLEQSLSYPPSSQRVPLPTSCVPKVKDWNIDGQSLDERGSSLASDVNSFSADVCESGVLPPGHTVDHCSTDVEGNVLTSVSAEPPRSSVITLAQQLETYWAQRGTTIAGSQPAVQSAVKTMSRPTAPPPAPPGSLTSTNVFFDRSPSEYDKQLTTQTLPRAGSTRSLQAAPPRPPPRTTTQDSYNASKLLGRSLPPEPSQTADMQMSFERSSLRHGQMTTFQSQRTLKESSDHGGGLSGSVQSLPSCDITSTSLVAGSTTSRGRPAPQPPRRGSSMSPRLQTKSTRYGGRARSASLRSKDNDDDDNATLQRLTNSTSSTSATVTAQRLETVQTANVGVRETSRWATVSGQKPVAQIRPHAIRSPSASSYTRQPITDDIDSKCSVAARAYAEQRTSVEAQSSDVQSLTFHSASASSDCQDAVPSNTTVSRFGTLRSRIKDYVTAAAGVGTNRKQQATSSSSSSFADWTLPRGRHPGVARRSSSATSWEPDHSDYGNEQSRGTASFDDSAAWSSSSYFGVFPRQRPFSSPRTRATEVSLPQNIVASADSSMSTADVTSSITSRISTFLTFLGGSRRPVSSSPTLDTPPSTSSATLRPISTSTVIDNAGIERPSNSVSETKTPAAKAVVDPIVSTLGRQSRSVSTSPPVRSSSTSEMLAKAAAAAAAAARDARGRQPLRFVREQRTAMSTFRNSGSLNVSVARSSSFTPHSTSAAMEAQQSPPSADGSQISDGRRTSKSGTLYDSAGQVSSPAPLTTKHLASVGRYAHQSAPSTPLDWNDERETQQTMTSSLPVDNSSGDRLVTTSESHEVINGHQLKCRHKSQRFNPMHQNFSAWFSTPSLATPTSALRAVFL